MGRELVAAGNGGKGYHGATEGSGHTSKDHFSSIRSGGLKEVRYFKLLRLMSGQSAGPREGRKGMTINCKTFTKERERKEKNSRRQRIEGMVNGGGVTP